MCGTSLGSALTEPRYQEVRDKIRAIVTNRIAMESGPSPIDIGGMHEEATDGDAEYIGIIGSGRGICYACGDQGQCPRECVTKGGKKGSREGGTGRGSVSWNQGEGKRGLPAGRGMQKGAQIGCANGYKGHAKGRVSRSIVIVIVARVEATGQTSAERVADVSCGGRVREDEGDEESQSDRSPGRNCAPCGSISSALEAQGTVSRPCGTRGRVTSRPSLDEDDIEQRVVQRASRGLGPHTLGLRRGHRVEVDFRGPEVELQLAEVAGVPWASPTRFCGFCCLPHTLACAWIVLEFVGCLSSLSVLPLLER